MKYAELGQKSVLMELEPEKQPRFLCFYLRRNLPHM